MAPKLHLRFQGLNTKSRANYRRALLRFFAFLKRENLCIPDSVRELDRTLGEFMNESFQEGDSPGYAGAAVSALKRFLPRLRSRLYTATQLYSNWIKVLKFTNPAAPRPFLGSSSRLWRAWRFLCDSGAWPLHCCFSSSFFFVPLRFTG